MALTIEGITKNNGFSDLFKANAGQNPFDLTAGFNLSGKNRGIQQEAGKSMLDSLTGGQSFNLTTTSITSVKATETNSMAMAQDIQGQTSVLLMQTQGIKAAIASTIEAAQREVHAVMNEIKAPAIFVNTSSDSTIGSMALDNIAGIGGSTSIVAELVGSLSQKTTSVADKKQIIAQIKEILTSKSNSNPTDIFSNNNDPKESDFNWNEFFAGGDDKLEALMTTDPNNPPPEYFPEFAAIDNLEHALKEEQANALVAQNKVQIDPTTDINYFTYLACQNLAGVDTCKLPNPLQPEAETTKTLAQLNPPESWRIALNAMPQKPTGPNA